MSMGKRVSKLLSVFFAVACVALLMTPMASAAVKPVTPGGDVAEPCYTGLSYGYASIKISSAGCSTCFGSMNLRDGYTGNMTLYLQKSSDGTKWTSIKNWNTTGSGTIVLDKIRYVVPGYQYRVYVDLKVYNSNNVLVDSIGLPSNVESY